MNSPTCPLCNKAIRPGSPWATLARKGQPDAPAHIGCALRLCATASGKPLMPSEPLPAADLIDTNFNPG